uniref:Uncharacterized protein n=1 Tax=Ascaris lumbricoides TaxID=6252 RepID=A0A0M3HXL0_ASCLU
MLCVKTQVFRYVGANHFWSSMTEIGINNRIRQERKSFLLPKFWKGRALQGRETLFDTSHMRSLLKLLLATKGERDKLCCTDVLAIECNFFLTYQRQRFTHNDLKYAFEFNRTMEKIPRNV